MNDDFYVGYLPKAPAGLGKIVARIVAGILLAGLVAGAAADLWPTSFRHEYIRVRQVSRLRGRD